MEKFILIVIIVVVLIIIYYFYTKQSFKDTNNNVKFSEQKKIEQPKMEVPQNWNDVISKISLEPSVVDSHNSYIANVRQFSSGANFSAVADDNTSPIFTNFIGFSRPQFVDIDPTARQIPDVDINVLKRNKRITFTNDYNL
jgi:uncharacterized protein YacL